MRHLGDRLRAAWGRAREPSVRQARSSVVGSCSGMKQDCYAGCCPDCNQNCLPNIALVTRGDAKIDYRRHARV
jgi:hypothetical protein